MGASRSKVAPMPLHFILNKLTKCELPEDEEIVIQCLEDIDAQLIDPRTLDVKMKQLKSLEAMSLLIKLIKTIVAGKV
jgi:hypothetical protein